METPKELKEAKNQEVETDAKEVVDILLGEIKPNKSI